MKTLKIVAGILLMLVALWGGSWLMTRFPNTSDYGFAALITAAMVFFGGVFLLILGFAPMPVSRRPPEVSPEWKWLEAEMLIQEHKLAEAKRNAYARQAGAPEVKA